MPNKLTLVSLVWLMDVLICSAVCFVDGALGTNSRGYRIPSWRSPAKWCQE